MLCTLPGELERKFLIDDVCEIFLMCRQNFNYQVQNVKLRLSPIG